jgi:hypothetical protein
VPEHVEKRALLSYITADIKINFRLAGALARSNRDGVSGSGSL